jgi:putative phosphonate metabolism protein
VHSPDTFRYAIYAAPPAASPLHAFAARWLGWDPELGEKHPPSPATGLDADRIAALTAEPRLYGFHGTLKPPFHLAEGHSAAELSAAAASFAAGRPALSIGRLEVAMLGSFLALRPGNPCSALNDFAAECVRHFDGFRRPASADELQRRRSAGLTARQDRYLAEWGYPYVFDEFRLHFTLTGKVPDKAERAVLMAHLQHVMTDMLKEDYELTEICLFAQAGPGQAFRIVNRFRLGGC